MLTDTQPIYAIQLTEAPIPKPRVRFRDYYCAGENCGRKLMRASLDNIAMALPVDFAKTHPLAYTALKLIVIECRCPKCGVTNSFSPMKG